MLVSLQCLTAWLVLVLAGLVPGGLVLRLLHLNALKGASRWCWALALGWLAWSGVLVLLGLVGLLVPGVLVPLSFATAAAGVILIATPERSNGWPLSRRAEKTTFRLQLVLSQHRGEPTDRAEHGWQGRAVWVAMAAAAAATTAMTLVAALAPPTAGDALCYHLNLARRFLEHGRLFYSPWDDNITYPLVVQLWYAWALALGPPATATLMHWSCGLLLAGAAWHLGQVVLGHRWAPAVATLVLLVPAVGNQMTVPLNDLPLALYATLALAGWLQGGQETGGRGWAVATGLAVAGALGVKYAVVLPLLGLGVAMGTTLLTAGPKSPVARRAGWVLLVAVLAGGFWYARAAWYRGNPVYPLLVQRLGGSPPPPPQRDKTPLPPALGAVATFPWQVTFRPEVFGGRGHRLGVLFLALLPAVAVVRLGQAEKHLLCFLGTVVLAWFFLRQNLRFLLPAVPVAAVLSVAVLSRIEAASRPLRWAAAMVLLVTAADALGGAARKANRTWAVACGWQGRQEYLAAHVSWLPACRLLEKAPAPLRVLTTDVRLFPLPADAVRESVYARVTRYHLPKEAPLLIARLRQDGFTHLLIAGSNRSAQRLRKLCRQEVPSGSVRLVAQSPKGTPPEKKWQLWELSPRRASPVPADFQAATWPR